MKKTFLLLLALIVLISCIFISCKKDSNTDSKSTTNGLESYDNEYGSETVAVTDKNGEAITDKNGKEVTTEVQVVYKKDKKGNTYAVVLDKDGNPVTDNKGKEVTVTFETTKATTTKSSKTTTAGFTTAKQEKPTGTTKKDAQTTKNDTTAFNGEDVVPKTSDSGKAVNFSSSDLSILKSMLEVPYLYLSSYENSDGVPYDIAAHTAVWMQSRETGDRSDLNSPIVYPSSPVVLNLFRFYGQTVVNFKTECNNYAEEAGAPIKYVKKDDCFRVSGFTAKVQNVSITGVEDLGNNNYYKVTGNVSGCNKSKVIAIVQKNKLDASLGFSIKALKWS